MCDYSLHNVTSRPAKLGDELVAIYFTQAITRGFAAVGEPDVAVCLLPGTGSLSRTRSSTTASLDCSERREWTKELPGSGRSKWTIRMSITTRSNSRADRS
jgi:hypothetical protein